MKHSLIELLKSLLFKMAHYTKKKQLRVESKAEVIRDKTMHDKLIYISNDDIQNYPFCRKLLIEKFRHC